MSSAHTNYRLDEAQAIMSELRTIKKAICTGEKERQELMQVKKPIYIYIYSTEQIAAQMYSLSSFCCL